MSQHMNARRSGMILLRSLVVMVMVWAPAAAAQPSRPLTGIALVVGQSKYEHLTPLTNPTNDAQAISQLFTELGFNVTTVMDRDARRLRRAFRNFSEDTEGADVAVVYYSGHGIESGGENWLVPVDADVSALKEAADKLVPLSDLLDPLRASVPLTLLFLDACRTSPFPPGAMLRRDGAALPVSAGGLSIIRGAVEANAEAATEGLGSVIGFAAEPGRVALDGPPDGNSPYAAALLRHLSVSAGTEFGTVMRLVTEEVYLKTRGMQRPWVNETLTKLLYFGGEPPDVSSDDARLDEGRRALLLSIDALDAGMRHTVETLARDNELPLDPIYGMLRQLQVDTSAGPEDIEQQLRAGVEAVKKLKAQRDTVTRTDPEIIRFTELADRAEAEGAIPLAEDYRARASVRAQQISQDLKQDEADIGQRRLEIAATFAREAETAIIAFDHRKAAAKFALAFDELEKQDPELARGYKWSEANALRDVGQYKGDNQSMLASIEAYRQAIAMATGEEDRTLWVDLNIDVANALELLGERQTDTTYLNEALKVFQAVLDVATREAYPRQRARTQNDLGIVLVRLGEREIGTERLQEAVKVFRAALVVRRQDEALRDWAQTQINLGLALWTLGDRTRDAELLKESVAAYRAALQGYPRADSPLDWAIIQNNLGNTLASLGEVSNDLTWFDESVVSYRAALEERTREKVPLDWAQTQNNLAISLQQLGDRNKDLAALEESIATYRLVLEEWTRETSPLDWARVQNNLGLALAVLGEQQSDSRILEEAADAYRAALEGRQAEILPLDWAQSQDNLARTLGLIGEFSTGEARWSAWRASIVASEAALGVYRLDEQPYEWTRLLNQIGYYKVRLGEEESQPHLFREAIPLLREALAIQMELEHEQAPFTADSLCRALLDDGVVRRSRRQLREAEALCTQALEGERAMGADAAAEESEANLQRIREALDDLR